MIPISFMLVREYFSICLSLFACPKWMLQNAINTQNMCQYAKNYKKEMSSQILLVSKGLQVHSVIQLSGSYSIVDKTWYYTWGEQ